MKRSRAYKTQGAGGGRELQYLRERQYFIILPCRMAVRSLPNLYRCCVERPFSRKLFSADHSRLLPSLDSPFLFLIKENERFDVTEMQFLREGMTVKSSKRSRLSGRRRTPEKLEVVFDWINRPFFLNFLSFFFFFWSLFDFGSSLAKLSPRQCASIIDFLHLLLGICGCLVSQWAADR